MSKTFDLPCMDTRKSFYGKAVVIDSGVESTLYSYDIPVGVIRENIYGQRGFVRLWSGYSQTTLRHVNSFLAFYGECEITKKEWDKLPVSNA